MSGDVNDICLLCVEIKEKVNRKHVVRRLMRINGVIVCPHCDSVAEWPVVKRGEA